MRFDPLLENVPWRALNTEHAHFAIGNNGARKYPADVAPFAGIADDSADSLRQLYFLLAPGEAIYLEAAAVPVFPGLIAGESIPALQMLAAGVPKQVSEVQDRQASLVCLTGPDAAAMVALTDIAFPGFFRSRTHEMGAYFGIRVGGELVAMAGERMAIPGYREISGVCTHPQHTGKGYAGRLIAHLMRRHAQAGLMSFLHVAASNDRAIRLYERLGFSVTQKICMHRVSRSE